MPEQVNPTAVLIFVSIGTSPDKEAVEEFRDLVKSAQLSPVLLILSSRKVPGAKYFIGSGKAEEVLQNCNNLAPALVVINHDLSPAQKRNLEVLLKCRVIDRTELILNIFAQRARTFEGKLQVELAQLRYASTRLVRGWTHLERQKGGIGLRGGPGETQLEVDRRMIRDRIKSVTEQLKKVSKHRNLSRRARKRATIPTISLVGYTNAGKSTLFNRFTRSQVYAADKLFATLDPTLRRITLPDLTPAIIVDTVGFIRDLPHELINAFHATLEETIEANLLLHVIDAHNPARQDYIVQVEKVIEQIGASEVPQLQVYNKLDLLPDRQPRIDRDAHGTPIRVWLSAETGKGIDLLREALMELLPSL